MDKKRNMALWVGEIKEYEELLKYTELKRNLKDDVITSRFFKDFNISSEGINNKLLKVFWKENGAEYVKKKLSERDNFLEKSVLLNINKVINKNSNKNFNSAIILYNVDYTGCVKSVSSKSYSFQKVGSFKC